jgi:hypothetical protein
MSKELNPLQFKASMSSMISERKNINLAQKKLCLINPCVNGDIDLSIVSEKFKIFRETLLADYEFQKKDIGVDSAHIKNLTLTIGLRDPNRDRIYVDRRSCIYNGTPTGNFDWLRLVEQDIIKQLNLYKSEFMDKDPEGSLYFSIDWSWWSISF